MSSADTPFHEAKLASTPIRDLGLTLAGTRLEPILKEFEAELQRAGVRRVRPRFYLSTEWGVPSARWPSPSPFTWPAPS
jgi:hypothetical protein